MTHNTTSSAPLPRTPKWKRELGLLRRDGLVKYVRVALAYRRFRRSVARLESECDCGAVLIGPHAGDRWCPRCG